MKQLAITAENFGRDRNLSPVLVATMTSNIVEQRKLAHKLVDLVDWANRNICVTLTRYNVEKPESSYVQVRIFAKKKEDEKFQQIVYVNFKLEEFIYLLDVLNSV